MCFTHFRSHPILHILLLDGARRFTPCSRIKKSFLQQPRIELNLNLRVRKAIVLHGRVLCLHVSGQRALAAELKPKMKVKAKAKAKTKPVQASERKSTRGSQRRVAK